MRASEHSAFHLDDGIGRCSAARFKRPSESAGPGDACGLDELRWYGLQALHFARRPDRCISHSIPPHATPVRMGFQSMNRASRTRITRVAGSARRSLTWRSRYNASCFRRDTLGATVASGPRMVAGLASCYGVLGRFLSCFLCSSCFCFFTCCCLPFSLSFLPPLSPMPAPFSPL